jgi:5-methylcytosine-specific restriction endonuclease McrA
MMRRCLLEPVPQLLVAANLLTEAVAAHCGGDKRDAARLLLASDFAEIGAWYRTIVGPLNPDVHGRPPNPPLLPLNERKQPRMPTAETKRTIIARDGTHCRFCESPVIPKDVILAISREYPQEGCWSTVAAEQHRFFQAMTLQFDHVMPHSRGGDSSAENVVITCAACNYGRINWTVAEVALIDPRTMPIKKTLWDGLRSFRASSNRESDP